MKHTVPAEYHNSVVRRAELRALELEEKLVEIITPILVEAAHEAADNFERLASKSLTAAILARRDLDYLAFYGREARSLLASLALVSSVAPNSTMIAIKPRPAEADDLAEPGGDEAENLHVTLAFLGPVNGDLGKIKDALAKVAATHAPLEGKVGGVGSFDDNGKGAPAILLPSVPGLVELRVAVTEALVEAGIDYGRDHGYQAHVTIAYDEAANTPSRDSINKPLHFDELLIVRGNRETIALPFVGVPPITAAASPRQTQSAQAAQAANEAALIEAGREVQRALEEVHHTRDTVARALAAGEDDVARAAEKAYVAAQAEYRRKLANARKAAKKVSPTTPLPPVAVPPPQQQQPQVAPPQTKIPSPTPDTVHATHDVTKDTEADVKAARREKAATATRERGIAKELDGTGPVSQQGQSDLGNIQKAAEEFGGLGEGDVAKVHHIGKAIPDWVMPAAGEVLNVESLALQLDRHTRPVTTQAAQTVIQAGVENAPGPAYPVESVPTPPGEPPPPVAPGGPTGPPAEPPRAGDGLGGPPPPGDRLGIAFDVQNPFVAKVLAQSGSQITHVAATTREDVRDAMAEAYDQGLSIPHAADLIRERMVEASPARARLIARTELAGVVNGGSLAATQIVAEATGDTYTKVWMTAPGAPHPRHNDYPGLDGQKAGLDGYFDVGGFKMRFPGDPEGPPEEVCNCRCALGYEEGASPTEDGVVEGEPEEPTEEAAEVAPEERETPQIAPPFAEPPNVPRTPATDLPIYEKETYLGGNLPPGVGEELAKGKLQPGITDYSGVPGHVMAPEYEAAQKTLNSLDALFDDSGWGGGGGGMLAMRLWGNPQGEGEIARFLRKEKTKGLIHLDPGRAFPPQVVADDLIKDFAHDAPQLKPRFNPETDGLTIDGNELVSLIDDAIENAPRLEEPLTVYRGMQTTSPLFGEDGPSVGQVVTDRSFQSTTVLPEAARGYAIPGGSNMHKLRGSTGEPTVLEIKLPAGQEGFWHRAVRDDPNYEYTLPRGLSYQVDSIEHATVDPGRLNFKQGLAGHLPKETTEVVHVHIVPTPPPRDVFVTNDPVAAAKALWEGRYVELLHEDQVTTLIEVLGKMASDAKALGKEAPPLDLGKVSVKGTNLFTIESKGIARIDMPQMKGVPLKGSIADAMPRDKRGEVDLMPLFLAQLREKGIGIAETDPLVSHLRATQRELDGVKVAGIMNAIENGVKLEGRIPVTKEGYILDGHHRWAAEIGLDYETTTDALMTIPAVEIDMPILELVKEANQFSHDLGMPSAGLKGGLGAQAAKAAPVPPALAAVHTPDPANLALVDLAKADLAKGKLSPEIVDLAAPEDYRIEHTSPDAEGGAPMSDVASNGIYPDDFYDLKTQEQYYGTRGTGVDDQPLDPPTFAAVNEVRGKPDAEVTVYRGVPPEITTINPGDWVTPNRDYAELHAASEPGWHVIEMKVRAGDLYTDGNSIQEWGWHPKERPGVARESLPEVPGAPIEVKLTGNWIVNPARAAEVEATIASLARRYDVPIREVKVSPHTDDVGQLAGKSKTQIYVSAKFLDDEFMAKRGEEWGRVAVHRIGEPVRPSDTIVHEFGHILDGRLLETDRAAYDRLQAYLEEKTPVTLSDGRTIMQERWQQNLEAPSAYATESKLEYVAEAFTDWTLNGEKAAATSQAIGKIFDEALGRKIVPEAEVVVPAVVLPKPLVPFPARVEHFPKGEKGVAEWQALGNDQPGWRKLDQFKDFDGVGAFDFEPTVTLKIDSNLVATEPGNLNPNYKPAISPIDVVKYGDKYYVVDGHHRVAQAIKKGDRAIEARVIDAGPELPPGVAEELALGKLHPDIVDAASQAQISAILPEKVGKAEANKLRKSLEGEIDAADQVQNTVIYDPAKPIPPDLNYANAVMETAKALDAATYPTPLGVTAVIREAGKLKGAVNYRITEAPIGGPLKGKKYAYVEHLGSMTPGGGTAMMRHVAAETSKAGGVAIDLQSVEEQIRFYEHLGFKEVDPSTGSHEMIIEGKAFEDLAGGVLPEPTIEIPLDSKGVPLVPGYKVIDKYGEVGVVDGLVPGSTKAVYVKMGPNGEKYSQSTSVLTVDEPLPVAAVPGIPGLTALKPLSELKPGPLTAETPGSVPPVKSDWKRIKPGDYDTANGWKLYRVPDHPPYWNVEDGTGVVIVSSAPTMKAALAGIPKRLPSEGGTIVEPGVPIRIHGDPQTLATEGERLLASKDPAEQWIGGIIGRWRSTGRGNLDITRDADGKLTGAIHYRVLPDSALSDSAGDVLVDGVASTVPGGGTELMRSAARSAADANLGLVAQPTEASLGFFKKIGMKPDATGNVFTFNPWQAREFGYAPGHEGYKFGIVPESDWLDLGYEVDNVWGPSVLRDSDAALQAAKDFPESYAIVTLRNADGKLLSLAARNYDTTERRLWVQKVVAPRQESKTSMLRKIAGEAKEKGYGLRVGASKGEASYYQEMGFKSFGDPSEGVFDLSPTETQIFTEGPTSTTIGLTPFRPEDVHVDEMGIPDNTYFYESPKARKFEADLDPIAKRYGVTITKREHVDGVWEGGGEPSWSLQAHDGVTGVRRFAEEMRSRYNQDAVMVFRPGDGDAVEWTISGVEPRKVTDELLARYKIEGATIRGDKLETVSDYAAMESMVAMAKELGGIATAREGSVHWASRPKAAEPLPAGELGSLNAPDVSKTYVEHEDLQVAAERPMVSGLAGDNANYGTAASDELIRNNRTLDNNRNAIAAKTQVSELLYDTLINDPGWMAATKMPTPGTVDTLKKGDRFRYGGGGMLNQGPVYEVKRISDDPGRADASPESARYGRTRRLEVEVVSPGMESYGDQVGSERVLTLGEHDLHEEIDLYEKSDKYPLIESDQSTAGTRSERVIAGLVDNWATTAADNNSWAFALQKAAQVEFGLPDDLLKIYAKRAPDQWDVAREIFKDKEGPLRAFVRAEYEATQKMYADAGITEVTLYRGVNFDETPREDLPSIGASEHEFTLQPASSFATDYNAAYVFASGDSGIIAVTVPVSRVLATPRTGQGCLREHEVIVLGPKEGTVDKGVVVRGTSFSELPQDTDGFWAEASRPRVPKVDYDALAKQPGNWTVDPYVSSADEFDSGALVTLNQAKLKYLFEPPQAGTGDAILKLTRTNGQTLVTVIDPLNSGVPEGAAVSISGETLLHKAVKETADFEYGGKKFKVFKAAPDSDVVSIKDLETGTLWAVKATDVAQAVADEEAQYHGKIPGLEHTVEQLNAGETPGVMHAANVTVANVFPGAVFHYGSDKIGDSPAYQVKSGGTDKSKVIVKNMATGDEYQVKKTEVAQALAEHAQGIIPTTHTVEGLPLDAPLNSVAPEMAPAFPGEGATFVGEDGKIQKVIDESDPPGEFLVENAQGDQTWLKSDDVWAAMDKKAPGAKQGVDDGWGDLGEKEPVFKYKDEIFKITKEDAPVGFVVLEDMLGGKHKVSTNSAAEALANHLAGNSVNISELNSILEQALPAPAEGDIFEYQGTAYKVVGPGYGSPGYTTVESSYDGEMHNVDNAALAKGYANHLAHIPDEPVVGLEGVIGKNANKPKSEWMGPVEQVKPKKGEIFKFGTDLDGTAPTYQVIGPGAKGMTKVIDIKTGNDYEIPTEDAAAAIVKKHQQGEISGIPDQQVEKGTVFDYGPDQPGYTVVGPGSLPGYTTVEDGFGKQTEVPSAAVQKAIDDYNSDFDYASPIAEFDAALKGQKAGGMTPLHEALQGEGFHYGPNDYSVSGIADDKGFIIVHDQYGEEISLPPEALKEAVDNTKAGAEKPIPELDKWLGKQESDIDFDLTGKLGPLGDPTDLSQELAGEVFHYNGKVYTVTGDTLATGDLVVLDAHGQGIGLPGDAVQEAVANTKADIQNLLPIPALEDALGPELKSHENLGAQGAQYVPPAGVVFEYEGVKWTIVGPGESPGTTILENADNGWHYQMPSDAVAEAATNHLVGIKDKVDEFDKVLAVAESDHNV